MFFALRLSVGIRYIYVSVKHFSNFAVRFNLLNMKKIVFSLFFFGFAQIVVFAQGLNKDGVTVELSKPYPVINASDKLYLSDDKYLISVKRIANSKLYIQSFDVKSLDLLNVNLYDDLDKNAFFESFLIIKNRFYFFYSIYDSNNKVEQLFVREIEPKTATFIGEGKRVLTVGEKLSGKLQGSTIFNFETVNKFNFKQSTNGDKCLIYYKLKPQIVNDKENYDLVGFCVYDDILTSPLWERVVEFPYSEEELSFLDIEVNSEGKVFVLALHNYKEELSEILLKEDQRGNYSFLLFGVDSKSKKMTEKSVNLKDKKITAIKMRVDTGDTIVLAGYYLSSLSQDVLGGVFTANLRPDCSVISESYNDLNKDVSDFNYLELRHVEYQNDGSVVLIGEEFYTVTKTWIDNNGRKRTSKHYCYSYILAVKISSKGKLLWANKIPKLQTGYRSLGGKSFKYMFNDSEQCFFYLDNIKNLDIKSEDKPEKYIDDLDAVLMFTKINNKTGISSKEVLFDLKNVEGTKVGQFETGKVVEISDTEVSIEVYRKKKKEDMWIRVKLK